MRGFNEQGTTTTPFDMVVLNEMSRYHLCKLTIEFVPRLQDRAAQLYAELDDLLAQHHTYSRTHFQDMPEISNWVWSD